MADPSSMRSRPERSQRKRGGSSKVKHFVVSGIGRSGTTPLNLAINLHPEAFCAVELFDHSHDHTGRLDHIEDYFTPEYFLSSRSRQIFEEKDKLALKAIGNKQPDYFMNWDRVLGEIGSPSAIVIFRELVPLMNSWKVRHTRVDAHWPKYLFPALAPFDVLEALDRLTRSQFSSQTLFVGFKPLFRGELAHEVYDQLIRFLGLKPNGHATETFLKRFVRTGGADNPSILTAAEHALADSVPISGFFKEIHGRGLVIASEAKFMAASVLDNARATADIIFSHFEACFEDVAAEGVRFKDLVIIVRQRFPDNSNSILVELARRSSGPAGQAIAGVAAFLRKDYVRSERYLTRSTVAFGGQPEFEHLLENAANLAALQSKRQEETSRL